jgi:anti-anti-sigma factor
MEPTFRAEARYAPRVMVLDMHGDLTKQAEELLLGTIQWDQGLGEGIQYLVVNLTHVPYINSAGIALLIRLARSCAKGGFQTFSYGVTPHYEKLFRMVGLTEYMAVYPDEYSIMERIGDLNT